MYIDHLARLANDQILSGDGTLSAHVLDQGAATPRRLIGSGEPLAVMVKAERVVDWFGLGLVMTIVASDNADLSSAINILERLITLAELAGMAQGEDLTPPAVLPIPPHTVNRRYLGVRFAAEGGLWLGAITVSAWVGPAAPGAYPVIYPDNAAS